MQQYAHKRSSFVFEKSRVRILPLHTQVFFGFPLFFPGELSQYGDWLNAG
jgi:hypothetical protein